MRQHPEQRRKGSVHQADEQVDRWTEGLSKQAVRTESPASVIRCGAFEHKKGAY
ncbi:hypothetical protein lacNasYZ01_14310 [Lactobacillus nasalidis]|nr:hypothetical protein lacNasYZ01_14310 [Lactobacillus nasalidis]